MERPDPETAPVLLEARSGVYRRLLRESARPLSGTLPRHPEDRVPERDVPRDDEEGPATRPLRIAAAFRDIGHRPARMPPRRHGASDVGA